MTRRTYGQFCGLAHALDVVGERWTLLIVRELNSGPKRYTQLADALSGIGTSLLAARVRQLEADNVIQRRLLLDQPSTVVAYELTPAGLELAQALLPLALWGARHHMTDGDADHEAFRAEWSLSFLTDGADDFPDDLTAVYAFHIDESVACLRVKAGRATVTPGASQDPADVTIRSTAPAVAAIAGGRNTLAEAISQDQMTAVGDHIALTALLARIEHQLSDR